MENAKQKLDETIKRIDGAYAPSTIRAYRTNFSKFINYCELHRKNSLPTPPEIVSEFIKELTDGGLKSASIRIAIASISAIHRLNRLDDPTLDPTVKIEMRRMHRKLGRESKQAYGITKSILNKLLEATDNNLRGIRDRALLYIAYDTLCRRSEIISLKVEDIAHADNNIRIKLRRSKTDPHGLGKQLTLNKESEKYLLEWLYVSGINQGYIFRAIKGRSIQDSLNAAQVNRIYKYLAKKSQMNSAIINQISGHSMRVGAAQDLLSDGATLAMIMTKGRWSKTDTVARYLENAYLA